VAARIPNLEGAVDLTSRDLGRRQSEISEPAVGRVEVVHHEIEGSGAGFDLVLGPQDEVRPGTKLENREALTLDDRSHPELHQELVGFAQAVGAQSDVAHPNRRSLVRWSFVRRSLVDVAQPCTSLHLAVERYHAGSAASVDAGAATRLP
jgi:hypothetical protein